MSTRRIAVNYLARVEGETNIVVAVPDRDDVSVELRIFEPPRFFEGFLVGRGYNEVGDIVARICGICPVSHMLTAIRAVEKAMGVEVSPQTRTLRQIMSLSQILASHLVHLYALAMPDYVGHDSIQTMMASYPSQVQRLVRMRQVVNDLTAMIGGGRALNPVGTVLGGFTRIPLPEEWAAMIERLRGLRQDAMETLRMVASFKRPDLVREREFVALRAKEGYAINGGDLASTQGMSVSEDSYLGAIEEEQVPYAMAKRLRVKGRSSMMVGALARLHVKFDQLAPEAVGAASEVGFRVPDYNPYDNNVAQAVELIHGLEDCISLMGGLEPKDEGPQVRVAPGEGAAITEAPRGLLYHSYAINRKGIIERADIITPTVHNFLSMEEDLHHLVSQMREAPAKEIRLSCEMLVRAYDPCFSCSVH